MGLCNESNDGAVASKQWQREKWEECIKSLTDYLTPGSSGLRISPLSLSAITFGTEMGLGQRSGTGDKIYFQHRSGKS